MIATNQKYKNTYQLIACPSRAQKSLRNYGLCFKILVIKANKYEYMQFCNKNREKLALIYQKIYKSQLNSLSSLHKETSTESPIFQIITQKPLHNLTNQIISPPT
jgi:hypothetical protein